MPAAQTWHGWEETTRDGMASGNSTEKSPEDCGGGLTARKDTLKGSLKWHVEDEQQHASGEGSYASKMG